MCARWRSRDTTTRTVGTSKSTRASLACSRERSRPKRLPQCYPGPNKAHPPGRTPPPVLAGAISSIADFIGNVQLARKLGHALKLWDFWQPAPDDATTQTAKLTRTVA